MQSEVILKCKSPMQRPDEEDTAAKHEAIRSESHQFDLYYTWLQQHMPDRFFKEITEEHYTLIAHYLMGFSLQDYFCKVELKDRAFVLALDSPEVDMKVLRNFNLYGIKNYQTFLSNAPPPFPEINRCLRIAIIHFTHLEEASTSPQCAATFPEETLDLIYAEVQKIAPEVDKEALQATICSLDPLFLRALSTERLALALSMLFRARTRDYCQYEVRRQHDWEEKEKGSPSLRLVFAWRNVPKYRFLFRLAKLIYRHNLSMTHVNATYIDPYSPESILVMSMGLHGIQGKAAWEETDLDDFLRELVMLKYFPDDDDIEKYFVKTRFIRGTIGHFLRALTYFIHQTLVHIDPNIYTPKAIQQGFQRHPKLTLLICQLFECKFHFSHADLTTYQKERKTLLKQIDQLDTGNEPADLCHKNILTQAASFIEFCVKTNFYRNNKSALSFRLDPSYLDAVPYDKTSLFPENPFAIFFIHGMHFIGFHIRFKDLARGGLRTVFPQTQERMLLERGSVFLECYNLAYTQQKKNKDIPEGGAKGIIFLEPHSHLFSEIEIYRKELTVAGKDKRLIEKTLQQFEQEQKEHYLYQTQRDFIHSLVTLVNCHDDGSLRAKNIVDYWKKPESLYIGPDETMHNTMITWIAAYSKKCHYKPGVAFISSKPHIGINHKQYGVTSFGVNVYMKEVLRFLKIDPENEPFTVKISGGPDGDVAGNQILNLKRDFPSTAKLLAITDVSGTIFDPKGLNLEVLEELFHQTQPIATYPPQALSDGGYLLNLRAKKAETSYTQKTLCSRKEGRKLKEEWLSGSEMNNLFRHNLHQVKTDIFIPAGGRPRTLHHNNYTDFLDEEGKPTARAIVEGANLYLTPKARRALEDLGVIIIKDSSANKGGVISSSMEVLFSLTLSSEEFLNNKDILMDQTLDVIAEKARSEARLLLDTFAETKAYLTDISELISERINTYIYQILDYLDAALLSFHPEDPLIRALVNFCPPFLRQHSRTQIFEKIPLIHKKAMIACYLASQLVYKKGLLWSPSVVDVLPLIATDPTINPSL